MRKISKGILGITATAMMVGSVMTTASFAHGNSALERAWNQEMVERPYTAIEYTAEDYRLARERGNMDEMWDAEFLAKPYAKVQYDGEAMRAANAEARILNNAR